MRKIMTCTLLVFLLVSLGMIIVGCSSDPLQKSEELIREDILELTPIGMSMDDVLEVIKSEEKWTIMSINYDKGYFRNTPEDV